MIGSAIRWYNLLSRDQIKSWTDLAKAFLVQYKHMMDTSPDRFLLQSREKNTIETFREYAHKWRDLVAQVQPSMTDNELNKMFLNTLKAPYYDRMIENSNTNFSDMVSAGDMIESGVKLGKIKGMEAKKLTPKKKQEDARGLLPKKSIQSFLLTTARPRLSIIQPRCQGQLTRELPAQH